MNDWAVGSRYHEYTSTGETPKSKRPGRWPGRLEGLTRVAQLYWPGNSKRVQPVVFTSRNSGVRGGSSVGFRKFTSKL